MIARFQVVLPLFGVLLLYFALRLTRQAEGGVEPERNVALRLARRWLPMAKQAATTYGRQFFAREDGRLVVMPMFLVLLVIETTDLLFAVDSVPAIFGITRDPFVIFTSNIFAIVGLRALYFLLAGAMDLFCYLNYGFAAVLGFIGLKMIGEWAIAHEEGTELVPTWLSLAVIAGLLVTAIFASLIVGQRKGNGTRQDLH